LIPLKKLNPSARWMLLSHLLWWLGETVGDTIVSVYTVRLTSTFSDAAWFQLWKYFAVPFGFLLGSAVARRFGGVWAYRLGVGGYMAFYGLVLFMRENILAYEIALGLLWGLAMGFYWLGWQLLILDLTKDGERDTLLSLVGMTVFASQLVGPPVAGYYLGESGELGAYGPLFAVVTVMFLLSTLSTWVLRSHTLDRAGAFWEIMAMKWKPEWKASLWTFFFSGFQAVMALFLAPLLAYQSFGNEKGAGAFTGILAGVGLLTSLAASHILRPQLRRRSMLLASLGLALSSLVLLAEITFTTLLIYGILSALIRPFYGPPFFATQQRLIGDSHQLQRRRADWLALRDFPIMFGRVIAALLIIYFVSDMGSGDLRYFVAILVITPPLSYFLMAPYIDGSPPGPSIARPTLPESSN
jgi:YQGE family putative transporter